MVLNKEVGCFGCRVPMRRIIRWLWILCALGVLVTLPLIIIELNRKDHNLHFRAWFIAGLFVILTVPVTLYEVTLHMCYYTRPRLQKHVVRILLMVPIYSVDAWFALRYKDASVYLGTIRECYEAFVIYSFYMYLMNYLQDTLGDIEGHFTAKGPIDHVWPLNGVLRPWSGREFLWATRKGILNYVIVRPLMTAVGLAAMSMDKFGSGQFRPDVFYPYFVTVNSASQMWALYCLIAFYYAAHDELAPIRPLSKFVCVKSVVFFSFWQSVALALAVKAGLISEKSSWTTYDATDVAAGVQDFMICVEMLFAALAHAHAFPPRDYMTENPPPRGFRENVREMFDWGDLMDDVHLGLTDYRDEAVRGMTAAGSTVMKATMLPVDLVRGVIVPQGYRGAGKARAKKARKQGPAEFEEFTQAAQDSSDEGGVFGESLEHEMAR
ncbi:unnamed protein product [Pedinophyceae sp. YPF-701]|nr:unnamed protein product [Pedinophyceae sp. YPF-701]